MCKKALLWIVAVNMINITSAQYEDDAPRKTFDTGSQIRLFFKSPSHENFIKGTEFMFSLSNGYVFGEISPFVGYDIAKPLRVGAGINGAFYAGNGQGNEYDGCEKQSFPHATGRGADERKAGTDKRTGT